MFSLMSAQFTELLIKKTYGHENLPIYLPTCLLSVCLSDSLTNSECKYLSS